MRYKAFILLPLIALICISFMAMSALSIDDTEGKSADQLIDESNGISSGTNSMFPASPQEARAIELGNKDKTSSKLSSSQASNPQEARSDSSGTSNAQSTSQAEEADASAAQNSGDVSSLDLSGSWLLSLDDGRNLDMVLYQNGGAVFGTGSMKDGDATSLVAASGSLAGDKIKLDIVTFGAVNLFRLTLSQSGDSIAGSYSAIPSSGDPRSAAVRGSKSG